MKEIFGIFKENLTIKIARLRKSTKGIRIVDLRETKMDYPLYSEQLPDSAEEEEELEEEFIEDIPTLDDDFDIPQPEDMEEMESSEETYEMEEDKNISGRNELRKLLLNIDTQKFDFSLNINEDNLKIQNFDTSFASKRINSKLEKKLLTKEERKNLTYSLDHIILPHKDKIRCYLQKGEMDLLSALQEVNTEVTKKKFQYQKIIPNEIALLNFAQENILLEDNKFSTLLYLGKQYKVGLIFKKDQYIRKFHLRLPESASQNILESVFSKLLLEKDSSSIPFTDNIYLAGEFVSDENVEYFQQRFGEISNVTRLELSKKNRHILETNEDISKEEISKYAIPISLAWSALDKKNDNFYDINLLFHKVIESQKYFKLKWHGYLAMALIFVVAFLGTKKNLRLRQDISNANSRYAALNQKIKNNRAKLANLKRIQTKVNDLKQQVEIIDTLTYKKNNFHNIISTLSKAVTNNRLSWLASFTGKDSTFNIKGLTTNRNNIVNFTQLFPNCEVIRIANKEEQQINIAGYNLSYTYPQIEQNNQIRPQLNTQSWQDQPKMVDSDTAEKPKREESSSTTYMSKTNSPKERYNEIVAMYFDGNYQKAYNKFNSLINEFPNTIWATNAYYLTGECLYHMKEYQKAIEVFQDYLDSPRSTKQASALLMIGNSYIKQNKTEKAVEVWNNLENKYPHNRLTRIAKNKIKRHKIK